MTLTVSDPTYPEVMTAVYRLYDAAGQLLYVGVAFDFNKRFKQHATHKTWWPQVARKEVIWFADRLSALTEEAGAIATEGPLHNARRGQSRIGLMVTKRPPSHLEGYDPLNLGLKMRLYNHRLAACPVRPTLEFNDTICRAILRERAGRRTEMAIIRDGQPVAMAISWETFLRCAEALGEHVDPAQMNAVALEDLCRKERAPLTLSVRLDETLAHMGV
jgi:predicted GIY-YIG superfamily endonuclease